MLHVTREREKNFVEKLSGARTGSISSAHFSPTEIKPEVFYSAFKKLIDLNFPRPHFQ